ncbi:hypothetical protein B0H10DRAFT_2221307 [Mycena sp. CBHHK59/15]|nr:hypothetical protein B0H10DRAFT_2221307 [Mycena sp. CBHHK59/15]
MGSSLVFADKRVEHMMGELMRLAAKRAEAETEVDKLQDEHNEARQELLDMRKWCLDVEKSHYAIKLRY